MSARGKTRRACSPDSPMLATDNNASNSSSENSNHPAASRAGELVILPGGVIGSQSATCSGGGMAASELLELSRRCFSCCNFVLQQEASICGEERRMVSFVKLSRADFLIRASSKHNYSHSSDCPLQLDYIPYVTKHTLRSPVPLGCWMGL